MSAVIILRQSVLNNITIENYNYLKNFEEASVKEFKKNLLRIQNLFFLI